MALAKTKSRPTRLFKMSDAKLSELDNAGFSDEDRLHKLTEGNIGTLFPGLAFVDREFDLTDGEYRLDTLAFDAASKTFVVIEYKNKMHLGVIDQAKAYLNRMTKQKDTLMVGYVKKMGRGNMNKRSYNFGAMYAIILAPTFDQKQIDSAEGDERLELYKVQRYGDILAVRRVGGGHERPNAPKRASASAPKIIDCYPRLPKLEHRENMHPTELAYPDGSIVSIEKWTHILFKVADWLVHEGRIGESHCPVLAGPKNALLHTKPIHPNGKKFRYYKRVGRLYVYLNFAPTAIIRRSINLIEIAGLDPSKFRVALAPN